MYYYIAEPVTTEAERRRLDDIKSVLSQLGIAGEFAVASPARTVQEHLELAFSKGFTTIVGIGSDALISKVAGNILGHKYDKAVMGAIPFQSNQATAQMIGASGINQIASSLKNRSTIEIDALQFGRNEAIITDATASLPQETEFHLRYGDVLAEGLFTDLLVRPNGEIRLWQRGHDPGSFLNRLFKPASASADTSLTRLVLNRWDFATKEPCALLVGGETIAETPFQAILRKKALKLIVNRATITPVKDQND